MSIDTGGRDIREAVGVFTNPDTLEVAVTALEAEGFDRGSISVLGAGRTASGHLSHFHRSVAQVEDAADAPRAAFVPEIVREESEWGFVGFPLFVGSVAGFVAVVASGGILAVAIGGALLGGTAGATFGGLMSYAVAQHHANAVKKELAQGGLVLWVTVENEESGHRALSVLKRFRAKHAHVHVIRKPRTP